MTSPMDDKIAEFTALLRENGLRVSMAEHLDAFHALERVGVSDRETFKNALRAPSSPEPARDARAQ